MVKLYKTKNVWKIMCKTDMLYLTINNVLKDSKLQDIIKKYLFNRSMEQIIFGRKGPRVSREITMMIDYPLYKDVTKKVKISTYGELYIEFAKLYGEVYDKEPGLFWQYTLDDLIFEGWEPEIKKDGTIFVYPLIGIIGS